MVNTGIVLLNFSVDKEVYKEVGNWKKKNKDKKIKVYYSKIIMDKKGKYHCFITLFYKVVKPSRRKNGTNVRTN